ncbi:VOC family protein [Bernardetia sp.]|uniref:VOC family protein n=1 Tax=Bernardetia sp. TaxID=1937974 RepID=UPI0025BBF9A6|nr:VOC family protein [Bernardetia sp.]
MIQKIKETCLYVSDLDKTQNFYHNVLELPIISRKEDAFIFFRAGSDVLLCFMNEYAASQEHLPAHFANGNIHFAFEAKVEDYQLWKNKIKEAGIEITHEQEWKNNLMSFYFEDPNKHVLEIVSEGIWDE